MTAATAKKDPEPQAPTITRFGRPDLNEYGAWMLDELRPRYPHLTERMLAGWLQGMIDSTEVLFLKTKHTVAMAQLVKEQLTPQPTVVERFVLAQPGYTVEASWHYAEFERWAQSLGAREIIVDVFTDVPRTMIAERIGRKLVAREQMIAKLK